MTIAATADNDGKNEEQGQFLLLSYYVCSPLRYIKQCRSILNTHTYNYYSNSTVLI